MAKRKTARKTSVRRSTTKARSTKRAKRTTGGRGLNLKRVRQDLMRAIEAMKRRPAALAERAVPESGVLRLEEMVASIDEFCTEDRGCGSTMVIPPPN